MLQLGAAQVELRITLSYFGEPNPNQAREAGSFPVGGWWKDWKEARQWGTEARYALAVSLKVADNIDADITRLLRPLSSPEAVIDINLAEGGRNLEWDYTNPQVRNKGTACSIGRHTQ
ncbi:hypothetical protein [Caballeronia telluris]|uniref:hypothetical protein n=1 Tax=Caballeronia telluris TaxID=326475 RepID=UPI00190EA7AE|nr:hypothetical protein [Caballeronia telluris]